MLAPARHQRPARDRERLQRVRADLQRDRDVFPRRGEEAAAEARLRREPDRVQHAVELAADPLGERVEVGGVGDVELDDRRLGREPPRRALREAHRPAERGEHHLGAFLLRAARDGERDRRVVEHAGDQDALVGEQHRARFLRQSGVFEWRRAGWRSRLSPSTSSASTRTRRVSARVDHRVDEAALGRAVRVVERGLVLVDQRSSSPRESRDRARSPCRAGSATAAGAAHHRDLGARPRDAEVVADAARVHHDVRAAVRLAQHHAEARHGGRRVRVHELGAVADHAPPFEVAAGLEAGRVDERDDREVEGVAPTRRTARPCATPRCRACPRAAPAGSRRRRPAARRASRSPVTRFGA